MGPPPKNTLLILFTVPTTQTATKTATTTATATHYHTSTTTITAGAKASTGSGSVSKQRAGDAEAVPALLAAHGPKRKDRTVSSFNCVFSLVVF